LAIYSSLTNVMAIRKNDINSRGMIKYPVCYDPAKLTDICCPDRDFSCTQQKVLGWLEGSGNLDIFNNPSEQDRSALRVFPETLPKDIHLSNELFVFGSEEGYRVYETVDILGQGDDGTAHKVRDIVTRDDFVVKTSYCFGDLRTEKLAY